MNKCEKLKNKILEIISNSPIPEDLEHAKNTLSWILRLKPDADSSLKIAALGHDIERAVPERIKRNKFKDFDEFKSAHALRSAEILKKILVEFNYPKSIIDEVYDLVKKHEHGGDLKSDILKDADSLSFFENNIKYFYKREGFDKTLERAIWGIKRLSPQAKNFFLSIKPTDENLKKIFDILITKYL